MEEMQDLAPEIFVMTSVLFGDQTVDNIAAVSLKLHECVKKYHHRQSKVEKSDIC